MNKNMAGINADLIAQKTVEYANHPGCVLGLDGWILRSLLPEQRQSFLAGYEKLLRIAFHPDRYSTPTAKASRDTFLMAVSEAVNFMLADECGFETIADTVPQRRNPFVSMRRELEAKDATLDKLEEKVAEWQQRGSDAESKYQSTMVQFLKFQESSKRNSMRDWRLRSAITRMVRHYPVPISLPKQAIVGRYIHPQPTDPCSERMTRWAMQNQGGTYTSDFLGDWIKQAVIEKAATTPRNLLLPNSGAQVIGAMTDSHLAEWINYCGGDCIKAFERLGRDIDRKSEGDEMEFNLELNPFTMPFYQNGMLLVIRTQHEKSISHRLLYVLSVNKDEAPKDVMLQTQKQTIRKLKFESVDLRRQLLDLKRQLKASKDQVQKLTSQIADAK